jgi:transposase
MPLTTIEVTEVLGGWEGYAVGTVGRVRPSPLNRLLVPEVWIELIPIRGIERVCSGCGERCTKVHDITARWVRDLDLIDTPLRLLVHVCRVACPHCGPTIEDLPWLEPYSRVTNRFSNRVAQFCDHMPISNVADLFDMDWGTVKACHKRYLEEAEEPVDWSKIEAVAIDEFAIRKGHRYATMIVDLATNRVIWVGKGRSREDIRPFFEQLGKDGCKNLKAVVMDMNQAFEEEFKAQCPNAEIVYDLFHVVHKYGREVIDRLRVDEANRLRNSPGNRKVIKGARWLLLRSYRNLNRPDRVKLKELLAANRKLFTAYVARDDLKHLWDYKQRRRARRFWRGWYHRAIRSRIQPLKDFARKLSRRLKGILAHCRWPFHTSLLEGMNNKIKVLKRMAYGFRDYDYFFLRIKAAFPGNA